MKILAIESSFDETAASVAELTDGDMVKILSEVVATSKDMHIKTGGAVPEVAAREQLKSMMPVLRQTIQDANVSPESIDAIAVTQGPGLIGSLLVGVESAKSLAWAWNKPLIPINHMLGHVYANWIESEENQNPPLFPTLALIVSGGHTELVLMTDHNSYQLVGMTRDDAAGECFDKCARVIDLPYPGGAHLAKLTQTAREQGMSPSKILPRPLLHHESLDLSFSGLKAAFVRAVRAEQALDQEKKLVLALDLESAIVEVLSKKVLQAIERFYPESLLIAGGVAANIHLRASLEEIAQDNQIQFHKPQLSHCIDNSSMIAAAALFHNQPQEIKNIKADPGMGL